jgi:hypothetical protein
VFHVIESLDLEFEKLFVSVKISQNENSFLSNSSLPSDSNSLSVTFILHPDVNPKGLLTKINLLIIDLLNQIMICRTKITDELIKVKVVDRANEHNPPSKDELKKRFFKIEEMRERKLIKLLLLIQKKQIINEQIQSYNDLARLENFLVGCIIFDKNFLC